MSESRTRNVSNNVVAVLICQILNLALNFVSRTIFVKTLGADYLGVNGLFSNVLSILSFAELGIGNALIFSMYEPLVRNDQQKLCSLLALYNKAYKIICWVVAGLGLLVIPFFDFIIKTPPDISENLILIYILYLAQTIVSYIYVYKKSIIIADQKQWVVLSATEVTHVLQIGLQIFVLFYYHSFIGFLIIQIVCTLLGNYLCAREADRRYPYIKNKSLPLDRDESKTIFRDVKAMAFYKFGSIILNCTSSILASAMISITIVGIASNYLLLQAACNSILINVTNAFTSSVGNLNVVGDKEHKYSVFNKILFITVWLFGFASVGLLVLSNPLVSVWLGDEYLLDRFSVFAIVLGFYVLGVHTVEVTYRITMGYFVKGKWAPLFSSILNILLGIVLGKMIGIAGIFIAIPISRFLGIGLVDTFIIFKEAFNRNPIIYFAKNLGYLVVLTICYFACYYTCSLVKMTGWGGVILQTVVLTIVFNVIMLITFYRTPVFKELVVMIKNVIHRI